MSYRERVEFTRGGSPAEFRTWIYFYNAEKLNEQKKVMDADATAAREIAELEKLIDDLKEYRQALAARYAQLETMPYTERVELERLPSLGSGVRYYLRVVRTYEDGSSATSFCQRFEGKQRREAIKYFEDLKRERPGIEAVKDIEKKSWER